MENRPAELALSNGVAEIIYVTCGTEDLLIIIQLVVTNTPLLLVVNFLFLSKFMNAIGALKAVVLIIQEYKDIALVRIPPQLFVYSTLKRI